MRVLPGKLTFRPGSVDDARFIADVRTLEFPNEPEDPAGVRAWLEDPEVAWRRFLAYREDRPAGFAISWHNPWELADDGFVTVLVGLLPEHKTRANLDAAYAFLEDAARADSGRTAIAEIREDDHLPLTVVLARGYVEDRRQRFWELDLVAAGERIQEMAFRSRARMREHGIKITTLQADTDADRFRKLHTMSSEAELDVPATLTVLPPSFEQLMVWLKTPVIHQDRIWIARVGDEIAGLSTLSFPVERGIVQTDWTAVGRAHRNRGIARALKLETLVQAVGLGVRRVRTDNDSRNAPILHLNEDLGYRMVLERLALNRSLGPF